MALTVTRPNYWTITLDSSGTGVVYKFKYVVLATFPSPIGTVQLRQSKNPQGNGHFDIEKLVKNYLKVTHKHDNTITGSVDYDSIHLMPQNTTDVGTASTPDIEDYPLSKNNNTIISVTFNCWEEYSTTADGTPDLQGTPVTVTYPFINYANEWEDEKELDVDLFSFQSTEVLLTSIFKWANYNYAAVLSAASGLPVIMSMNITNTDAAGFNRIETSKSGATTSQTAGVRYNYIYKIENTIGVTNLQIYDGSSYLDIPFSLGWNEFTYTCQVSGFIVMNVQGQTGGRIDFSYTKSEYGGNFGKFLTEIPTNTLNGNSTAGKIPHLTSYKDYKLFSWFNNLLNYNTDDGKLVYMFFDDVPLFQQVMGHLIPTNYLGVIEVDNNSNNGGENPSSSNADSEYLLYAGVGGANVKSIKYPDKGGYQLLEPSSVKYYSIYYASESTINDSYTQGSYIKAGDYIRITIEGGAGAGEIDYTTIGASDNLNGTQFYATGSTDGTGAYQKKYPKPASEIYLFEIASDNNCNPTRFEEYSLTWKNKYGTWDYYMFDGEHTDVRNYKRETDYNRVAGGWSDATFTIDSFDRGKVQKVTGTKQTTINTRFITDEYNDYFNGLLMSNEVLLLTPVKKGDDDIKQVPIPINIQDTSLTFKTNLKDKLVQYSFTFEYAHNLKQRV